MAGGVGTRFWPLSRTARPKQFLDILGLGESLLQMTYNRFAETLPAENIYIVTNESYRSLIQEQIPTISDSNILGEPMGKNTAPCIAYACYKIHSLNPDAVAVVAPSDHLITKEKAFATQIEKGLNYARDNDVFLTLGIKPSRPDTGYGYIQFKEETFAEGIHDVKTFTEKPNEELANEFINSGDFLWNAGIFIWKLEHVINGFSEHLTELAELFEDGKEHFFKSSEREYISDIYPKCPSVSIDVGLIEKAGNVGVLPSDFGWSDLGTWKSLYDVAKKDVNENVVIGKPIESHDSKGNLIMSEGGKLVILEGVHDLFVLNTEDALLVCNKDKEQEVKNIVNKIKVDYDNKYT